MSNQLYLVRHGQTIFNTKNVIQGWSDSPLTPLGREQARLVGAYLRHRGIAPDHVYASPTGRTRETTECITSLPYETDRGLLELFFGNLEGEHGYLLPDWPWRDFLIPFGGETQDQLDARMCACLSEIMSRPNHELVLAVSHGTACQTFLEHWQDQSPCRIERIPGNCSLMHLEFDGEGFRLLEVIEQPQMREELGLS